MAPAVLNWLALAGWGAGHGENSHKSKKAAPSSTELLTLSDLIEKVRPPTSFVFRELL